jgi:hypothetical protein
MRYERRTFALTLVSSGHLLPWLGLALRGVVGRAYKEAVCVHPPAERDTRWVKCDGCPHQRECGYARLYEPAPSASAHASRKDGPRPLVLAPHFPVPEEGRPGLAVPVRLAVVGADGAAAVPGLMAALASAGRDHGLGPDRVLFEVGPAELEACEVGPGLPLSPDAVAGTYPRVGVGLTAPLFLKACGGRMAKVPSLAELFRASHWAVLDLARRYGMAPVTEFRRLLEAAEGVRLVDHCYETFVQPHVSTRQGRRYKVRGVVGGGVYADVPAALLPWLLWGGRLHVGEHRVAGAGGWRIVLD